MTSRERLLAIALGAFIAVGGGGFLVYQFFWQPYQQRALRLKTLQTEIARKTDREKEIEANLPKLHAWQQTALPESPTQDPQRTKREYEKFLSDLIRRSGIPEPTAKVIDKPIEAKANPMLPGKGPIYTKLAYTMTAKTDYASLVRFFEGFYRAPMLHELKNVSVKRESSSNTQRSFNEPPPPPLSVVLTVEALILPGSGHPSVVPRVDRRVWQAIAAVGGGAPGLWFSTLAALPSGPAAPSILATPSRDYTALAARDIFRGAPPSFQGAPKPEWISPRFTKLNHYSSDDRRTEIYLYDVYNNNRYKLRATSGFDYFALLKDSQHNLVAQGVLVRIDLERRECAFRMELTAQDAPSSSRDRAQKRAGFFRLDLEKLDQLKKDKSKIKPEEWDDLTRDQAVRAEYGDHVLRVDRDYWEGLIKDKMIDFSESGTFQIELNPVQGGPADLVAPTAFGGPAGFGARGGPGGRGGFGAFGAPGAGRGGLGAPADFGDAGGFDIPGGSRDEPRIQLIKGKIVRGPGSDWYVKVDEKYCALHLGESLEDSLKKPLTDSRIKELKTAVSAASADAANAP